MFLIISSITAARKLVQANFQYTVVLFIYISKYLTKLNFHFRGSTDQSRKTLEKQGLLLPEGTPANVTLAEVLMGRCLLDQQLNLCWDIQGIVVREVPAGELVSNPVNDLNSFLV